MYDPEYCPTGELFHGRKCALSCAEGFSLEKCRRPDGKKLSMSECQPECTDGTISHRVVCTEVTRRHYLSAVFPLPFYLRQCLSVRCC
eukprot:SAG22_NODE_478_length_9967_cov_12.777260_7_plen_88_part_00